MVKAKIDQQIKLGESLYKADDSGRKYKARRIERVKGGWSLVTYDIKDDKIESIDRSTPDLKAVIIEKFKIETAMDWNRIEE